jgi:DNA-binding NarL/FixJ family response regulator
MVDDKVTFARIAAVIADHGMAVVSEGPDHDPVDALVVAGELANGARDSAIRAVHERLPRARVVVMSSPPTPHDVRRALEAGAHGFVLDGDLPQALAPTIRAVCAGQSVVPEGMRTQVLEPAFSHRERQVLGMVVRGLTNAEIAAALFLAESTVKSHLSTAFTKLGVRSRTEATALILDSARGLRLGVLPIPSEREHASRAGDAPPFPAQREAGNGRS